MKTPFVSICCITYNHEPYIKDTLEGFVNQKTNFPFEIIISDDCSKDKTRDIIEEYKAKYPELIRDISPQKNMGSQANFYYVQEQAEGKYIAICEGDDFWTDPLKLQKQVDILEEDDSLIVCCTNYDVVDKQGNLLQAKKGGVVPHDKEGRYNLRDFFRDNHSYPTLSVVYRNSHKEEVLAKFLHTQNAYLGDWTLWICLLIYGDMYYLNQVTCAYRINPTSITHTANRVGRAKASREICRNVADILPAEYADIAADLRKTNWVWISLIFAYRAEKRYLGMLGSFIMAAILCPKSLWRTIRGKITKRKTNKAMFKYTKRLLSDIRFWAKELKLRRAEYKEFERIEDEEWRHPMAGFGYYQTMNRNRAERKRLHAEQRANIR